MPLDRIICINNVIVEIAIDAMVRSSDNLSRSMVSVSAEDLLSTGP